MTEPTQTQLYGVMAEFNSAEDLMAAAVQVCKAGFTKTEAYSPYPIEGLTDALGKKESNLPMAIFFGGLIGGIAGFGLQFFASVVSYPYEIGGRPFNSWPAFIPIIFELTVLFAAFTAVFGMLGRNGLPKPYHPVFNVDKFSDVTKDKFFLCIEASDSKFSLDQTSAFLEKLSAVSISEVKN